MKSRVVVRADASKATGYGHFYRSLALASYLKGDFDIYFSSYNEDNLGGMPSDNQLDEIWKVGKPLEVFGNALKDYNEGFLNEIEPTDIVVLDNYYFDTDYQRRIKDKGCKLVSVDDMHRYHMVSDLLMTVCPLKRSDFSLEDYTEFRGGIEWAFLREPFLRPVAQRAVSEEIGNVVLGMGGADAFNLTDKMVGIVRDLLPKTEINVICGESVDVSPKTKEIAKIHRNLSAEEIVSLFDKADIGIFPASTICIEALSRRLPVIAGHYVDNQLELYDYGVSHGYFSPGGDFLEDAHKIEDRLGHILGAPRQSAPVIDFSSQREKIVNLFKTL